VACKHKGIDENAGLAALGYLFEGLRYDERIEAESVLVNTAVFQSQSGGFSVSDHDNLAHVFALTGEQALGEPQTFTSIRVVRPHLHSCQFAERHFFGAIVEEHEVQRIAGILRADQMRESHGYALGRRKAVFAVENHAVAAVEH